MTLPRRFVLGSAAGFAASMAAPAWAGCDAGPRPYNLRTAKAPQRRLCPDSASSVAAYVRELARTGEGFSVLSSGNCFAGLSQHGGTVLDLRAMNRVALDPVTGVLTAGPAATLGDVNRATSARGLALPAGYCQNVALGGHVCGGGIGVLARRHGLACDHLISARVVLASGEIVLAAPDGPHADLFWALRGGGGGSYGIVTAFHLGLVPAPRLTGRFQTFGGAAKDVAAWLARWLAATRDAPRDLNAAIFLWRQDDGLIRLHERLIWSGRPEALDGLLHGQADWRFPLEESAKGEVRTLGYHQMADHIWPRDRQPSRHISLRAELMAKQPSAGDLLPLLVALTRSPVADQYVAIETLGGAIDDPAAAATAYLHRGTAAWIVQLTALRVPEVDFAQSLIRQESLQSALAPLSTGASYINYPETDRRGGTAAYFGANLPRLRRIKTRYDPGNLFRHALTVVPYSP